MRRKDREITDKKTIIDVIRRCTCCRLGFSDDDEVYIVPLSFGFSCFSDETALYFHCANEGRKIDLIKRGKPVGFEMDTDYTVNEGKKACEYSAGFKSIIGTGEIRFVTDTAEKTEALKKIMEHNTGKTDWTFSSAEIDAVCVFMLRVKKLSCKIHE